MTGVLAAIALAVSSHAAHPCLAPQPRGPAVPAPLVLHTSCGWYEHDPNGRTFRLPNHWGAIHGSGSGRRYGAKLDVCFDRTRHIRLCLHGRLLWQSRRRYPGFGGDLAFGPHEFAFADYFTGVYLTDLRRPERLVVRGRALYPDDFTRNGDLVVVAHGVLVVVSADGRIVGRHRYRTGNGYVFDWRSDTYLFVTPRGRLAAFRDRRVRLGPTVASLGALGIPARGLVVFARRGRVTVMREDGGIVASANWNARAGTLVGPAAWPAVWISPDRRTFVYVLSTAKRAQLGQATLFVLHPGARRGHRLLRRWQAPTGCFEGGPCFGGIDWNGRFFLYQPGDGHVGIVDSATGRLTDLTHFDRSLPHLGQVPEQAVIAWKRDFPR